MNAVYFQIFLAFGVGLNWMANGIRVGWFSEFMNQLADPNSPTNGSLQQSSLIQVICAFAIIIFPIAVWSSNEIGRNMTMYLGSALQILATLSISLSLHYGSLIWIFISCFVTALAFIVSYVAGTVYLTEIAQANARGRISSLLMVICNIGMLLSFILIWYVSLATLNLITLIPLVLHMFIIVFAPESPYFLVMKNKIDKSKQALKILRNNADIENELNDIKITVERNKTSKGSIFELLTDPKLRKLLLIAIIIQAIQQFTGIDALLMYHSLIFKESKSDLSESMSSILFIGMKLVSSTMSTVLLDKVGRKPLLLFSCLTSVLTLGIISVYFYLKDNLHFDVSRFSYFPFVFLMIFIAGYNVGLGSIPTVMTIEIFPTKYRAHGAGINLAAYNFSLIVSLLVFSWLKDNYGFYLPFLVASVTTFLGFIYVEVCVFETKGKTLRQIQDDEVDKYDNSL